MRCCTRIPCFRPRVAGWPAATACKKSPNRPRGSRSSRWRPWFGEIGRRRGIAMARIDPVPARGLPMADRAPVRSCNFQMVRVHAVEAQRARESHGSPAGVRLRCPWQIFVASIVPSAPTAFLPEASRCPQRRRAAFAWGRRAKGARDKRSRWRPSRPEGPDEPIDQVRARGRPGRRSPHRQRRRERHFSGTAGLALRRAGSRAGTPTRRQRPSPISCLARIVPEIEAVSETSFGQCPGSRPGPPRFLWASAIVATSGLSQ